MKKYVAILMTFVATMLLTLPVHAQTNTIVYGDIVTGEITDTEFEIEYTFEASAGDVVVIEMTAVDPLGDLNSPELVLLGTDNRVLTDTADAFNLSSTVLATELPTDGTYTIIAGRRDGRAGDSVGEFTLELILPDALTVESTTTGFVSSEGRSQYFLAQSESLFSVFYEKTDGEMSPEISVNILDEDSGGLEAVATMQGDLLSLGTLGVFSANTTYVVAVGEALFDFNFREVTTDFTLQLQIAE